MAEDHPLRLALQHELGKALLANRQVKEALRVLERVVITRKKVLAQDHPPRLMLLQLLASAYQKSGQIKEAV